MSINSLILELFGSSYSLPYEPDDQLANGINTSAIIQKERNRGKFRNRLLGLGAGLIAGRMLASRNVNQKQMYKQQADFYKKQAEQYQKAAASASTIPQPQSQIQRPM